MPLNASPAVRMRSLGTHLALSYLAVILIGIGTAAPLAWLAVERLYLDAQQANLLAQAELIAAALGAGPTPDSAATPVPYSQLSNVSPGIHTRVIDEQGAVVIDLSGTGAIASPGALVLPQLAQNAAGNLTPEELLTRPEIIQARGGQPATAVRQVEAAGGRAVLYAAAPVVSDHGSVDQIVYLAMPLPDSRWTALPVGLRGQLIGVLLGAVLIASAAGLLLARRISQPLGDLAAAAEQVAAGKLQQTVPVDSAIRELSILGRAFNAMTSSLRQADQAKNVFIADVTHELRTPLTVIKGTIETLQDGAIDDLNARETFLEAMRGETNRLIRLVNDLLVLTRADAGALNLQLRPVDLGALARGRCANIQRFADQRQVRLEVVDGLHPAEQKVLLDPTPAEGQESGTVLGDADRLAQVLDNLLDNAIRYSPAAGLVQVRVDWEVSEVRCQVIDCGPGIPASQLALIFERFTRVDPARGRSQGGSGLGLAIVRSLVCAHGGRVEASSSEGQGATLTFWLPVAGL